MRAHNRILILFLMATMVAIFIGGARPADADTFSCDLSGASYATVTFRDATGRHTGRTRDADVMAAPEAWEGTDEWVGYEAGGFSQAYLDARRVGSIDYYDAQGNWLHWIDLKADTNALYVMIMPASGRDGSAWHGCAAFSQPRGGSAEAWIEAITH